MKRISTFSKVSLLAILLVSACTGKNQTDTELKNENESIMESEKNEYVTLINSFEVPTGELEAAIKYWESCRDFLKNEPGYVSTKLHQSLTDSVKFQLVNVAMWESPQAFKNASDRMNKAIGAPPVVGLKANPSLYTVIRE